MCAVGVTAVASTSSAATKPAALRPNLANIPIVVADNTTTANFMPFYVALQKGYFADAGLNVSLSTFQGGDPPMFAAFSSGAANMVLSSASDIVEYVENGLLTKSSGKLFDELVGNAYDIVAQKSITSLSEIQGKTIGISGANGSDELFLEAILEHYHIPVSSVAFVNVGGASARLTAISTGAVNVIAEGSAARATSLVVGNVLLEAGKAPLGIVGSVFYANKALVARTAELKKFTGAMLRATKWMKTNEIAATNICIPATSSTQATCSAAVQALLTRSVGGKWTWSSTEAVDPATTNESINIVREVFPQDTEKLTASELIDNKVAGTSP